MPSVPPSVLVTFFQEATADLNKATLETPSPFKEKSLKELQQDLLKIQLDALNKIVDNFDNVTAEQVQAELKTVADSKDESIQQGNTEMNDAARFAFCRLVLHQECLICYQQEEGSTDRALISKGTIDRAALMEFCGLCAVAMKMPIVRQHLKDGTPLFGVEGTTTKPIPASMEKRLERIQQHMMTAVGYDTTFGTSEFQRIFLTPQTQNEFSQDVKVAEMFGKLISATQEAMTNILMAQQPLNDKEEGGVTRVVSVNYSEKQVDAATIASGDIPSAGAPRQESMNGAAEAAQRQRLQMAKEAALLQQKILGELMSMEEGQRKETLEKAKETNDKIVKQVMEYPPGPERVAFMQSMDAATQKDLLMHKIWTSMKEAHGGKEPTFVKHTN